MDEEEAEAALTVDDDHLQAVSLSFVRGLSALPTTLTTTTTILNNVFEKAD